MIFPNFHISYQNYHHHHHKKKVVKVANSLTFVLAADAMMIWVMVIPLCECVPLSAMWWSRDLQ